MWGVTGTVDARTLPTGTPICVDAAVSGVGCGALSTVDDQIEFGALTQEGDSGAVRFVVTGPHTARVVGILDRGASVEGSDATRIQTVTARLGVTPITATR
jgi:hypothetical protein